MKNRLLLAFLLFLCFSSRAFSQYILAANHGSQHYYYDFIPDDTLSGGYTPPSNYSEDLSLDLNNDGINDLVLRGEREKWGHWYAYYTSTIIPLNGNKIAIERYDSCFALSGSPLMFAAPMSKAFSANDTINMNENWIDQTVTMSYEKWNAMTYSYACSGSTFPISTPAYIGVMVYIPGDTLFGWIKIISLSANTFIVDGFACNKFSVGIGQYLNDNSLSIFPNPSNGLFHLKDSGSQPSKTTIRIFNSVGKLVYKEENDLKETIIDLTTQSKGVYLIDVLSENQHFSKKVLVN